MPPTTPGTGSASASGPALFGSAAGELTVGGVPASLIAERAGGTPLFAYDRKLVVERVAAVREALPAGVKLSYAVKANPMPALLHHMSTLVDGFDVASSGEMLAALDTGVPGARIAFAGPGKTAAELRQAVAAGVLVELESAGELDRVRAAGAALGVRPRVAVRVNPPFAVHGSGMRMGGGPQQFGVDAEQVPELLAEIARDTSGPGAVGFEGFHVFAGSQNLSAESICRAQRETVALVAELAEHAPAPVRYLNLGGGFGIPYSARDVPLDPRPIGENLAELLETTVRRALPQARPVIELGRYLVGEAGVYLTRVVDRKESRGTTYLVVDGGLHHQLAATGNLGRALRRNYPIAVAGHAAGTGGAGRSGEPTETVDVVGCLCTPLDLLGRAVELPRAEPGALIAVFQAGAYGLTASPTAFLGHPAPRELLL
ncbi:pyridoxal-dependent decarboxylase, exosortase A system-associated [Streptomyces alkaliphilus]|uniref:Pyridoxal-dependent decarboxylase, exosortase A system-associated n=2 Tax=Streptomyces alkaliphilus TaxID=1472722 RepID=A0A7W3T9U5_9ACTN|nr:pyridoxal-dependent decarboxylase, exosortase A system-associated [Streptomyces alkaliphilus]